MIAMWHWLGSPTENEKTKNMVKDCEKGLDEQSWGEAWETAADSAVWKDSVEAWYNTKYQTDQQMFVYKGIYLFN